MSGRKTLSPLVQLDLQRCSGRLREHLSRYATTVLSTAGHLFRNGEANSAAEAVQMALQAHGVNQGPSSSDPQRRVWRWQREPKAVGGQRVVQQGQRGAGFTYDPKTGQVN